MPTSSSTSSPTLHVELGDRSYPIHIDAGLLTRDASASEGRPGTGLGALLTNRQIAIVTNTTVAPLYADTLERWLHREAAPHGGLRDAPLRIELDDGEFTKKLETIETLVGRLLDARFDRGSLLIALGGGVVGDITGFAAAIYQRGVEFLQIPTTLLAQVDSSVGGKTGVNHPLGKNMIGAFHQPRGVLIDIDTLTTLPERERRAGIAEIIKYGLVFDADFFAWLEAHIDALAAIDPDVTREAILRSCEAKARVVALDEREGGARALLNLGHTFGHAIEAQMGYGNWLHGEAVGTGMAMAARLSGRLGWMPPEDVRRAERLIDRAGLALYPPDEMTVTDFVERMAIDKKVSHGRLRLVLLKGIGAGVVRADFDAQALEAELAVRAASDATT